MASNKGTDAQPQGRASLLLPNANQTTKVPSRDQSFLANLKHPRAAFPTNLRHPRTAFPGNLNLPATFPGLPGQMQPLVDYNPQSFWDGSSIPDFDLFLPMPQLRGQIATPPAGSGFAFNQAGATVNPVGLNPFPQFPAAAFDASGSNPNSFAMDPMQLPAEPVDKAEDKTSSIPLVCLLCPNTPKFSDTSHLLTHVSSKSHLAAQFKLQHSGKSEDQRTLDRYKLWSDSNGVDKLVASRIAAKELKKPAKRQRLAGVEKKTGKKVKIEPDDSISAHLENTPLRPIPNIWHLHAPRDVSFETLYGTPSYDHGAYPLPDSPENSAYIKKETSQSGAETANTSFLAEAADVDDGGDASKLKGTVYPGMGLFDAATPLQKRKRNQKKHASVVRNMELTSASIGQDEEVWDITMSHVTRTRNVYDSPSIDGSPDSKDELSSSTKKRRSRRSGIASAGPRRQTRAVTRAADNAKVGTRRSARQAKKLIKLEEELDSEDDSSHRLDDDEEKDSAVAGGDVFQDHHQIRQDAPGIPSGHQFDLSFRNAMNTLPSNTPLMTSSSLFPRPNQSFFPGFGMKENDGMAFSMQQPGNLHGYFPPNRQTMQTSSGSFNPLYLQRQDTYPFYGGHSFEAPKPPTPVFHTMNGAEFGGMDPAPSFQPGPAQQDDFEV